MNKSIEKRPFSDNRWTDNPFEGATVTKGEPLTPEEQKKADEIMGNILKRAKTQKSQKTDDANG